LRRMGFLFEVAGGLRLVLVCVCFEVNYLQSQFAVYLLLGSYVLGDSDVSSMFYF